MYILTEAFQNFISVHAASTLQIQTRVSFDPIMHHSKGNDHIVFHTFLLIQGTDKSTFITGRAHYSQQQGYRYPVLKQ